MLDDPEIRQAYERIKERQRKLDALRLGVEVNDDSDVTSGGSDATATADRKSVTSAYSYTQGYYRPDVMALYESQRAMGINPVGSGFEGGPQALPQASDETALWIRQQEEEIAAR